MKKQHWLPLILVLLLTINTSAQDNHAKNLLDDLTIELEELNQNSSDVSIVQKRNGKKVVISGKFDDNTKSFVRRIRYQDGIRKEKVTVKHITKSRYLKYLKLVLIDGEYFYVKKYSYFDDAPTKCSKVEFVGDQLTYSQTTYKKP